MQFEITAADLKKYAVLIGYCQPGDTLDATDYRVVLTLYRGAWAKQMEEEARAMAPIMAGGAR